MTLPILWLRLCCGQRRGLSANGRFLAGNSPASVHRTLTDLGGLDEYHPRGSSPVKLCILAEQAVKTIRPLKRLPKSHFLKLIDMR